MHNSLNVKVDIRNSTLKLNDFPTMTLPKCKGLEILNFLARYQDRQFSPTQLRLNCENNHKTEFLQFDEISYLIEQSCQNIPATDRKTIKEVINELKKNSIELEDANVANDIGKTKQILKQNEALTNYLDDNVNFNNTIKNLNRTRTNDVRSIKRTLAKLIELIRKQDPLQAEIISKHLVVNSSHTCLLSEV